MLMYVYLYTDCMGQRTIGIRDEVYEQLVLLKQERESFSDLFLRLAESHLRQTRDWTRFVGFLTEDEGEAVLEDIRHRRRSGFMREV